MNEKPLRRGTRLGTKALRFTFDGRAFEGIEGDTAASALLANGVRRMGRSVKYRRLRGVLCADLEEPNALLSVGPVGSAIPNVAATRVALENGLVLRSQNRWPTLDVDVASTLRLGGGLLRVLR